MMMKNQTREKKEIFILQPNAVDNTLFFLREAASSGYEANSDDGGC